MHAAPSCYIGPVSTIQWFPGHMTKARKVIAETMPDQDVVIEVLDARMPHASENPLLTELRAQKPCVKVLSKSDLADPAVTKRWLARLEATPPRKFPKGVIGGRVLAIAISTTREHETRTKIAQACSELARPSRGRTQARALIVGIPNVGKSTLVNTLAQRKIANVGDIPAVTKGKQTVELKNGMFLSDNPGIMWPKIEDPYGGLCLAFGGAIPDNALDYEIVGLFGAKVLLHAYPELVCARYKLTEVPKTELGLLEAIGRRRGCLQKGGTVDVRKAADIFIHEFRTGLIGRVSLERPEELDILDEPSVHADAADEDPSDIPAT
ncbi:MAG: ribosome biosis GTPase YlqF [Labilithrix sp.]|nr:ribosome biosis GTPase YlqF [Labilithrix sp.]